MLQTIKPKGPRMMAKAFVRQPLFKWLADGFKFKTIYCKLQTLYYKLFFYMEILLVLVQIPIFSASLMSSSRKSG